MKKMTISLLTLMFVAATQATPVQQTISAPTVEWKYRDNENHFIYMTVKLPVCPANEGKWTETTYQRNEISGFGRIVGNSVQETMFERATNSKSDDIIVYPTGSEAWNWNAHIPHTHHNPGTLLADVKPLLKVHKVDVIILSLGVDKILQVDPSTLAYLKEKEAKKKIAGFHILETREAIAKYNELVKQGKRVGALLHSTC